MSCSLAALSLSFLLFLRAQSVDLTPAQARSPLDDFKLPEIDGSPVDNCRIFLGPTPDPITARADPTPPPITTKLLVTPERPAAQKPETKDTGAPFRPEPVPAGPITNSHSDLVAYFRYLLANSTKSAYLAAGLLPGSHSGELAATNRLEKGSSSSEDSSDES